MAYYDITLDRKFGPQPYSAITDSNQTTYQQVSQEKPIGVPIINFADFYFVLCSNALNENNTESSIQDNVDGNYEKINEIKFSQHSLSVFSKFSSVPNNHAQITIRHKNSKNRLLAIHSWYNIGKFSNVTNSLTYLPNAQVDLEGYRIGARNTLTYAVLAIGQSQISDTVTIPHDWNLLSDGATNYGDGKDIRLVICYQISNGKKKLDFTPILSIPRIHGTVMFSHRQRLS